ncbi:MAG: FUSC family protein [Oscillospiraceae bacterium]|jgi:uncharacterized membrane protein YgaE (UPF0421/DUF939 family)|nr:FUSC family protein [Oscillospiraceae bacterium]
MNKPKQSNQTKIPGIGMRTIKSALAVGLCLLLYEILGLPAPFYACVAALICMQGSPEASLKLGISRIIGTAIGGAFGILLMYLNDFILNGALTALILTLGVIICIYVCLLIRQPDACALAGVVLCAIIIGRNSGVVNGEFAYAIGRIVETAVGIFISFAINRFVNLPRHKKRRKGSAKP